MHHKSWHKTITANMPNLGMEVKGRHKGEIKFPSPCRRNQMLCAIHRCQNANRQEHTKISQPFLPYDEPDLCNDYISKELGYNDRFCINFPCHCVLWTRSFGYQSTCQCCQCGLKEGSCTTNQETKECRPTQIETGENN